MKFKQRMFIGGLTGLLCLFSLSVNAANCEVRTSLFSFPVYEPLTIVPTDSSTQIAIQCDVELPFRVKMNGGLYAGGNFSVREMRSGETNTVLRYNLYRDSTYSQVWGDGQSATYFYQGLSSTVPTVIPIFGRVPPVQKVGAGLYSDSIVITLEW